MKKSFLFLTANRISIITLLLCFLGIFASAQSITLSISGDFVIPDNPQITQNGDTLRSSSPIGNRWYKDGKELAGEINQALIMKTSGNYKVSVTLGSGCSAESTTFSGIKTDVPIIKTADFTCKVFPNPNNGMFIVELETDHPKIFELELYTSNGESIIKESVNYSSGIHQVSFGKTSLASGVYYLQIKHGQNNLSRQIIVN